MAKYEGWRNFPTIQFKEILSELEEAKAEQRSAMIIADTGVGKTNAIRAFAKAKPKHTYVVTMGDSMNLMSLLVVLQSMLQCDIVATNKSKKHSALLRISKTLRDIGEGGGQPMIILDESENCKVPTLKAIKELYDHVSDVCSIVLIGTPQLTDQLTRKAMGKSIPQLRRRFKAGTRFIAPFNRARDMKPFFSAFIPQNEDLQDLLIQLCDNYGELHDYLHSFLTHCEKRRINPTVEAFRMYHKIPSTIK